MFVHRRLCQETNKTIVQRFCCFQKFLSQTNQKSFQNRRYYKTCENLFSIKRLLSNSSVHLQEEGSKSKLQERGATLSTYYSSSSGEKDDHSKTEDLLYDMFKDNDTGLVMVGKFIAGLQATGLRKTDPRLANLMSNLRIIHKESGREGGSYETQKLDKEKFQRAIAGDVVLISRAFRNHFIIPDFQDFCKHIEEFYWSCKTNTSGKVASYIPQLARANPEWWGVSVCTIDGQRFSIGDVTIPFTLQSCSKPLTYGIALDHLGEDVVHQYVGQEPSGRMFNELVLDYNMKPHNPMINAGAILICSLLKTLIFPNMTLAEKFDFTMDVFKGLAGGEYVGFNNAVFLSEREAADRNYALGFYMREHKCFPDKANLKESMDFYFQ